MLIASSTRFIQAPFESEEELENIFAVLHYDKVQARLEARPDKLWSLAERESTGGEPDVAGRVEIDV